MGNSINSIQAHRDNPSIIPDACEKCGHYFRRIEDLTSVMAGKISYHSCRFWKSDIPRLSDEKLRKCDIHKEFELFE